MSNSLQRTSYSSIQNYSNNNLSLTELRKLAINPQMYNARVTRMNPCALVIMIDQSGSMSEDFYDTNKAEAVANIVNDLLADLTKEQWESVHDIGFGGLVHLRATLLPRVLCPCLVGKFDYKSYCLVIEDDKFPITGMQ